MNQIAVYGAGAFGTALACVLAQDGRDVTLIGRDVSGLQKTRKTAKLGDITLPSALKITDDISVLAKARTILWTVPMQQLSTVLSHCASHINTQSMVACCKGVDLATGTGPAALLAAQCPTAPIAVLTGPSFAADIAAGLPTALTLACHDKTAGQAMQAHLSTPVLRLYLSTDVVGAELGGALKNTVAIAAGIAIGAGLGQSARAALVTRGFAELRRFALHHGADRDTLSGLSGLGDLVLTCTSEQSRNYRYGVALGQGDAFDPAITVEGAATAKAVAALAQSAGLEMPITTLVAAVINGKCNIKDAVHQLMSRPLKEE